MVAVPPEGPGGEHPAKIDAPAVSGSKANGLLQTTSAPDTTLSEVPCFATLPISPMLACC